MAISVTSGRSFDARRRRTPTSDASVEAGSRLEGGGAAPAGRWSRRRSGEPPPSAWSPWPIARWPPSTRSSPAFGPFVLQSELVANEPPSPSTAIRARAGPRRAPFRIVLRPQAAGDVGAPDDGEQLAHGGGDGPPGRFAIRDDDKRLEQRGSRQGHDHDGPRARPAAQGGQGPGLQLVEPAHPSFGARPGRGSARGGPSQGLGGPGRGSARVPR